MTGFFDDNDNVPMVFDEPKPEQANALQIQTKNSNLGAVRVSVPRDLGGVMRTIDQMAQVFGGKWLYRLPFKNKKTGKTDYVEGPTIGCTLDIARAYGNASVEVGRVEETKDSWIYHATFLDIETGFQLTRPFRQRRNQNIGGMGGDQGRAEDIVFQIGASKAIRNVTRNALRGLIDEALDRASRRLTAKVEQGYDKAIAYVRDQLAEHDIDESRITKAYASPLDKLKPAYVAQIIKMFQALNDREMTAAEFLPEPVDAKDVVDDHNPETGEVIEKKKTAPRVKIDFRGKERSKTNFIRDMKFLIKESSDVSNLAELHKDYNEAVTALPPEIASELNNTFGELFLGQNGYLNQVAHDEVEEKAKAYDDAEGGEQDDGEQDGNGFPGDDDLA